MPGGICLADAFIGVGLVTPEHAEVVECRKDVDAYIAKARRLFLEEGRSPAYLKMRQIVFIVNKNKAFKLP
ncbi:MAG: hypothetical protein PHS07_03840 [Patescibacteria group bacterium]|nr:hypothetical protein [Patescibacteria group bacterium]